MNLGYKNTCLYEPKIQTLWDNKKYRACFSAPMLYSGIAIVLSTYNLCSTHGEDVDIVTHKGSMDVK